jgi:hypothetical protein
LLLDYQSKPEHGLGAFVKILVSNIEWDTSVDDLDSMSAEQLAKHKKAIKRLPDKLIVEVEDRCATWEFDEIVAAAIDKVSDETGWLVQGSSLEMLRGSAPSSFVDAFNRFCRR